MTRTPKKLTDQTESDQHMTPNDLVKTVISMVRLAGAIFLRAEYNAPWAYESPPSSDLTHMLLPGAQRLILFHIISEGQCYLRLNTGEHLYASAGEVVILPYGHQHLMGSAESVRPVAIASLLPAPPWKQLPVIHHGGDGARTSVICGYLHCADPIFDPVFSTLPPLFSVKPPTGPIAAWIAASIQYAMDVSTENGPSPPIIAVRLPELLFGEILRLYAETGPLPRTGWLTALRDPIVGAALVELHADPTHKWTLEELSHCVACSPSTLNEKFSHLIGRPPMRYFNEWRLQIAADLLRTTTLSVASVAYRVGYESEEGFNRAFKRALGSPPATWRLHAQNG